jgi:hypothetical protein
LSPKTEVRSRKINSASSQRLTGLGIIFRLPTSVFGLLPTYAPGLQLFTQRFVAFPEILTVRLLAFLVSLCCAFTPAHSQENPRYDSLQQYSYRFSFDAPMGGEDFYHAGGTGFFIRKKDRLYFITARHVMTGCGSENLKDPLYPDSLSIIFPVDSTRLSIGIKKWKDSAACKTFVEMADIMAIAIDTSKAKGIASLEKLIAPLPANMEQEFVTFGYPTRAYNPQKPLAPPVQMGSGRYSRYKLRSNAIAVKGKMDSYNYWIEDTAITIDRTLKGRSGSPVFTWDKKSNSWKLMGVFVGSVTNDKPAKKFMVVCKLEELLKILPK